MALIPTWWLKACTKHYSPYIIDYYYYSNLAQLYANLFEAFAKFFIELKGKLHGGLNWPLEEPVMHQYLGFHGC